MFHLPFLFSAMHDVSRISAAAAGSGADPAELMEEAGIGTATRSERTLIGRAATALGARVGDGTGPPRPPSA